VSYETGMKAHTLITTTYIHAAPRDAVLPSMRKTGAKGRVRHQMIGAMQDPANGFRRIPLPRTSVNKGAVREVEFHSCLSLVHGARG
jgi:hypothetical protein